LSDVSGSVASLRRSPAARSVIGGVRRLSNLGGQLRASVRRGVTVIYYHRIVDSPRDPWQLSVSPANFAEHVEVLAASGRPVLSFGGMVEALRNDRLPPRAVAVTFDDGYADNALTAVPLLEQAGVPATFFVVVDAVDAERELWWDELERIFLAEPDLPPELDLVVAGERVTATIGGEPPVDPSWRNHEATDSVRAGLFVRVWRLLLTVGVDERDITMDALAEWSGRPRTARPERRLMTASELRAMVASPAAEVGSHTIRHPNLTLPNDREREVVGSRAALAEMIGRPVTTFAYPNGYHDAAAVDAVDRAGYRGACTTDAGVVTPAESPFKVPRYGAPNVGGDAFERFVRALG